MADLLHANVFIQAKNLQYGFDFCPAFWQWLERMHGQGHVYSIRQVGEELRAGEDELAEWGEALGDRFFYTPDGPVLAAAPRVSAWETGRRLRTRRGKHLSFRWPTISS